MIMIQLDYSKLRGRIKEKIGTEGEFARQLGRSHNYLTKVFQGKTFFSQADVLKAAQVLGIEKEDIGLYFFSSEFTKAEPQTV